MLNLLRIISIIFNHPEFIVKIFKVPVWFKIEYVYQFFFVVIREIVRQVLKCLVVSESKQAPRRIRYLSA